MIIVPGEYKREKNNNPNFTQLINKPKNKDMCKCHKVRYTSCYKVYCILIRKIF